MRQTLAVVLMLGLIVLLGCGSDGPEGGSPASTESFSFDNWDELVADPDAHKQASVDLVGRVFRVERYKDGVYLQVWADPRKSEWNTIVIYPEPNFKVREDDYIHVRGTVLGEFEGENMLGAKITAPEVLALSIQVVDATAAGPKASRTVTGLGKQTQHGLAIVITKVEYASTETRVFLTVTNGTEDNASFYSFSAKATQGTKQFEPEWFSEYPEVQSDLLPGIESSGVVLFPAMSASTETKIYLEARTDDYMVDFEPYVFTVPAR